MNKIYTSLLVFSRSVIGYTLYNWFIMCIGYIYTVVLVSNKMDLLC